MQVIRKASFTGSATKQMTNDKGEAEKIGPNGVPIMVAVQPEDAPSGGISVSISDRNGVLIFSATGITEDTSYGIDDAEMKTNGCAGPLSCTCNGEGEVLIYVDE